MKLQQHPTIVYRIPKFPYNASIEECWNDLRPAIATSSKDFYLQIESVAACDIERLPERTRLTIWKYFNRARYRCVPYGSFASVGICNLNESKETPLVVSSQPVIHQYMDWSAIDKYQPEINLEDQDLLLFSNSSWYKTTNAMRYIGKDKDGYELLDNVQDSTVLEILEHCGQPITIASLKTLLIHPVPLAELKEVLQEMISLQMLFTSAHSNIIGTDYWSKTPYQPEPNQQHYEISINQHLGGTLPKRIFRHVPELAERLALMVAENKSTALDHFINGFQKRFEGKEIPIMTALDPEMGLGYADLETWSEEDELIARFAARKNGTEDNGSPVEQFFRRQLGVDRRKVIQLEELDLEGIKEDESLPMANATALLCSVADELLVIDLFGGATGTALHGRFSLAAEDIKNHCKSLCNIEAEANPEVLFFDIAYQVGNRIDNVNRRAQLYEYSLSILNFDTSADPLSLSDILVSVSGGQVLLRSKKHNKRLIPRLASAYNYSKSDLAVFRFFCDLQHQGIQTYLQLDIAAIFKGLTYYPRVQYKNIIVSPAKWRIKKEKLFNNKQKDTLHCRSQLEAAGVERYFKNGFSDQTLMYDSQSDADIHAFLSNIEKQDEVELKEAFIGQRADVIDEQGNAYCSQFVLSYTHDQKIYKGFAHTSAMPAPSVKLPGSEWLYFEIYCHPQRANELLQQQINPFLARHHAKISQWFFIRYHENGPHIRVRFKLNHADELQPLLTTFSKLLQLELESGIVAELMIRSYKREVHRYGAALMDAVEHHFCIDSNCVLTLLSSQPDNNALYQHCIRLIQEMAGSSLFEAVQFEDLLLRISDSFNQEHQLRAGDFRKLNESYKSFSQAADHTWSTPQQSGIRQLTESFISTLTQCESSRMEALFGDLIHMHVNRLFSIHQRSHEMVMYYFCHKYNLTQKARRHHAE